MKNHRHIKKSYFDRYLFELLLALEVLMSFTFLGYIHLPPISITIAYIPIIIAASLLGKAQSTYVSLVFGLASMFKASANYVMADDKIFSPFQSGYPVKSILLSVGSRVLFGFLVGLLYDLANKSRHSGLWRAAISAIATRFNAFFVYLAMGILFPEHGYTFMNTFKLRPGDAAMAVLCICLVELCYRAYNSSTVKHLKHNIDQCGNNPYIQSRINHVIAAFGAFILAMTALAALYFSQRASYMLTKHGINVSSAVNSDLLHLHLQFFFAVLALNFISIILLTSVYKYMAYREYLGEMDDLTGVMGRRMFMQYCDTFQNVTKEKLSGTGWYLIADVDYFKNINDTFGHTAGDKVLKDVAVHLNNCFAECGAVGRIGGDEFAAVIDKEISQDEIESRLDEFLTGISDVLPEVHKVTCSIGVCRFKYPQDISDLLKKADEALYKAKKNGRDCYVIEEF